jgi:hypothetical protein
LRPQKYTIFRNYKQLMNFRLGKLRDPNGIAQPGNEFLTQIQQTSFHIFTAIAMKCDSIIENFLLWNHDPV